MKLRVIAAAAAAVLLAGCGSVHPGAAAVVDGTVISMGDADDTAQVYCRLTVLQGSQGAQAPSSADIRREAVRDLVIGDVARDLAKDRGIVPSPSSYQVTAAQRRELEKVFPAGKIDAVVDIIEDTQRTYAIVQELGKRAPGVPATDDPAAIQQAGLKVVQDEMDRRDISYDPRFRLKADGKPSTTSLSASRKPLDASTMKGLPATQQCA